MTPNVEHQLRPNEIERAKRAHKNSADCCMRMLDSSRARSLTDSFMPCRRTTLRKRALVRAPYCSTIVTSFTGPLGFWITR